MDAMPGPLAASLSGSFGWFHMADILQAVGLSKRPSKISVIHGYELVSNIFVDGDLVVDAVSGGFSTPRAFYRALDVKADGRFTVYRMAGMPARRAPMGALTAMVLDYSVRRRESNPDLFETGMEQGVGRTLTWEVFLEGWLGDYPLEDVIPALVHPDRASQMTLTVQGRQVGSISIVGRYLGPCEYHCKRGVGAFYEMFCALPSKCFFQVQRIPIDHVSDSMLIGHINHLLIGAVVHRDEVTHEQAFGPPPLLEAFTPELLSRPTAVALS